MRIFLAVALMGALIGDAAASSGYDWSLQPMEPMSSLPESVVIGDVTGDGRNDVVLATQLKVGGGYDHSIFIYPQRSDGTLGLPYKYAYTAYGNQVPLALADLNGDGTDDILIGGIDRVEFFVSNGSGGHSMRTVVLDHQCTNLATLDIDSDGKLDVVAQSWDSGATLLYGNGEGDVRLRTRLTTSAGGYNDVQVGDVNGDGRPDLIVVSPQSSGLFVYLNNGDGGFGAEIAAPRPQELDYPRGVAVGDFNGDGRDDIAVSTPRFVGSELTVYSLNAVGALNPSYAIATGAYPNLMKAKDLDNDGLNDVAVSHFNQAPFGLYTQTRTGLETVERQVPTSVVLGFMPNTFALGDFTGDGCADAAFASASSGGFGISHGVRCFEPWAPANQYNADFDGDGRADILWHNAATGANAVWRAGNSAAQIPLVQVTDTAWTVAGIGDFNGDGKSDVLWHHIVTGANAIWYSANYYTAAILQQINDPNWQIVGIGDFDGNGKDDILWRHRYTGANAIWREGSHVQSQNLVAITDLDWKIVGVGDFDGNGKDDILWRHARDGRNAIWRNADYYDNTRVEPVPDQAWQVAGMGDFDHDGRSDILWRRAFDGQLAIWRAAIHTDSRYLTQITDLKWKVAGVGDYDRDGRSDILWRHSGAGFNTIWRSANSATEQRVAGVTDMNWKIER